MFLIYMVKKHSYERILSRIKGDLGITYVIVNYIEVINPISMLLYLI